MTLSTTSTSLLVQAAGGDQTAWQRLVQIYGPLVYAWARRTGLQPQDAADATQETFAAVAPRLASYDPNRPGSTFRGWLWTITRNKAADVVREQQRQAAARGGSSNLARLHALNQTGPSPDNPIEYAEAAGEQSQIVQRALALMRSDFEPTTWQAFWRTTVDGLTADEVAAELSLSRWAVYKARSRVLHALRAELAGLEHLP